MDYREGPMVSVREFCEIHEIAVDDGRLLAN